MPFMHDMFIFENFLYNLNKLFFRIEILFKLHFHHFIYEGKYLKNIKKINKEIFFYKKQFSNQV